MNIYNPITKNSIFDEIDRICATDRNSYLLKDKVARYNDALDRYFDIARETGGISPFDDSGRTSAPIETQNIVSGTNYYKFSSFTNEVLGIIKMAILNSDGDEITVEHLPMANIENFDIDFDATVVGAPSHWLRYGDYIYLKPCPDYNKTNGLRAYVDRVAVRLAFTTFTVTAATDLINATAHGLSANDIVIFETDNAIPAGMTADKPYYVISSGLTADVFKVSETLAGSAIDITDTGTGNHQFLKISGSAGIPSIHHLYLARQAALPFLIEKSKANKNDIAALIAQDENRIYKFFADKDKDIKKQLTFASTPFR